MAAVLRKHNKCEDMRTLFLIATLANLTVAAPGSLASHLL
jgi:hypothetical protein